MNKLFIAAALMMVSGAAMAQANDVSGANPAGMTGPSAFAVNNTNYTDTNGDGALDRSELKPGSQLERRFATRDKNGDGKLTCDEYFFAGCKK